MARTIGIHWITSTFGTWLHGDPRGSWRDGKLIGPDPFLEEAVRGRMTRDAVVLSDFEMELAATTFGALIQERRWPVYAATIQPTHVHLVFAPPADPIKTVIAALKYRSAAAVLKLRRTMLREAPRSLWTEGQFPVFIEHEEHLLNAIEYVRRHNRRFDRADDPYPWITPFRG